MTFHTTCTFIHCCQVSIQVTGVTTAAGNFLLRRRYFTEGFCIVCDISQDDQNVHILFKCQIFSSCQCHFGCTDTFYGRVICQVDKYYRTVDSTCLFEVIDKEFSIFKCDTDSREYYRKFGIRTANLRLSCDLNRQIRMGQTGTGEDGQFLTTNQCIQTINGRYTSLDEFRRIDSCRRVDGRTIDVQSLFGDDFGTAVHGVTHTVEDTTQNVRGYAEVQTFAQKTHLTFCQVDTCCRFKQLYQSSVAIYFQNLAFSDLAVGQFDFAQFIVCYTFNTGNYHQRASYFLNGTIFLNHTSSAPFLISSATSFLISASISS